MASGIKSRDVDFDDLFDQDIIGDGPVANGLMRNGTAVRYANVSYGARRADVGIKHAGTDVAALWAAKGTAVYVDLAMPSALFAEGVGPPGSTVSVAVTVSLFRDGALTWYEGETGTGTWARGGATVGDAYEVRFTQIASNGRGTFTGSLNAWMQINQTRTIELRVERSAGGGSDTGTRTIRIEVRRMADGGVLDAHDIDMTCTATIEA